LEKPGFAPGFFAPLELASPLRAAFSNKNRKGASFSRLREKVASRSEVG
jgi:hypothetical protein